MVRGGNPGAAQLRGDTRRQLVRRKRFRDVIVGASVEQRDGVGFSVTRGQHDDRRRRHPANAFANGESIKIGKSEIEDDEIGIGVVDGFDTGLSGRSLDDRRMLLAQRGSNRAPDVDFIFYDEKPIVFGSDAGHAER